VAESAAHPRWDDFSWTGTTFLNSAGTRETARRIDRVYHPANSGQKDRVNDAEANWKSPHCLGEAIIERDACVTSTALRLSET
jgi:hypothetical protein